MKIKPKQYAQSLFEIVKDANKTETKKAIKNFADILVRNNHTSQVEKILDFFVDMWNKEKGIITAEISSARELDKKTVKMINEYIVNLTSSKNIEFSQEIDETLIGGIVLKYNNKIVDNSLRARVQEFKKTIAK